MQAFKDRRPWATIIISIFFSPIGGMLYLGKGLYAAIYFLSFIILGTLIIDTFGPEYGPVFSIKEAITDTSWIIGIIGTIHCFLISRRGSANTNKWYSKWYSIILLTLLVPLTFAFIVRTYFYHPYDVQSQSMAPNLNKGDYFIVRVFYKENFHRGNIIVFKKKDNLSYVKRIIGMPGDKITYKDGIFSINGKELLQSFDVGDIYREELPERNNSYRIIPGDKEFNTRFPNSYEVPSDSYFVVGDNRANSLDSRFDQFGYVAKSDVSGLVVLDIIRDDNGKLLYQHL